MNEVVIVFGGAGFIGARFVCEWRAREPGWGIHLDKLDYAVHLAHRVSGIWYLAHAAGGRHILDRGCRRWDSPAPAARGPG